MTLISIITPCFNEEENVKELYEQVRTVFVDLPQYEYEHIFIDNASKDRTVTILKEIAQKDNRIKNKNSFIDNLVVFLTTALLVQGRIIKE